MSMLEKDYYPIVEKWMIEHFKCFETAINSGLKISRVDVVGVRDVGGNLSGDIETIVIEVKRGNQPFATASGQAYGYKVYGNRVYLADIRNDGFTTDEVAIANHLGIGLIQIKSDNTCQEFLSSPHHKPLMKFNRLLLEQMRLGYCQFCNTVFKIGNLDGKNKFNNLARTKIKNALTKEKGLVFWNHELSERKQKLGIDKIKEGYSHDRRFVCSDCVSLFFQQ